MVLRIHAPRLRNSADTGNKDGISSDIVTATLSLVERFIREPRVPAQAVIDSQFWCDSPSVFGIVVHAPLQVLLIG